MNNVKYETIRYSKPGTVEVGRKLVWLCDVDYGIYIGGRPDGAPGTAMLVHAMQGPEGGPLTVQVQVDNVPKITLSLTPAANDPDTGSNGPAGIGSQSIFVALGQVVTIDVIESTSPVARDLAVSVYYRTKQYANH